MRIAARMNIAFRTINDGWYFESLHHTRRLEITRPIDLNLTVAALPLYLW